MLKKSFALLILLSVAVRLGAAAPEFSHIAPLLSEHCLDCHGSHDPEANFVMETFETLMKGGESGAAIVPGKSEESLLVQMIEGRFEKNGKKKIMPPGKRPKLTADQIASIRAWIDAGAQAPAGSLITQEIKVPTITPAGIVRKPVTAIASTSAKAIFAIARHNEIEIRSSENRNLVRKLTGHRGSINGLVFSADGSRLFSAGGESGLPGEVREWNLADGTSVRSYDGHKDSVYGIALSPDGKRLATGSYDQKIKMWNTETGKEIRTLSGHNGCVYALAFRPDGKILASASGDRTVKLWDAATGERRDTLSQSLKELYTVAFSPNGKHLIAAGVDNRIRLWEISDAATETTNPLLMAKFGHEGAILKLAFSFDGKMIVSSADDRTVKLWNASDLSEKLTLPNQPDWSPALAFSHDNKAVAIGRLDGEYEIFDTVSGKPVPLPAPEITRIEPRGIERGTETKVSLFGKNLHGVTNIVFGTGSFKVRVDDSERQDERTAWISPATDLPRSAYEFSAISDHGSSGKVKLYVEDIPQISSLSAGTNLLTFPIGVWGTHAKPGDSDKFKFEARKAQTLVFNFSGREIGSKADGVLTIMDESGKVLASNNGFDGSPDPFLTFTFPSSGTYQLNISEQLLGGSFEHFYHLTAGEMPFVTGFFPLVVGTNQEADIQLIGPMLSGDAKVHITTKGAGEIDLPMEQTKVRFRRKFKVQVSDLPQSTEKEPNDSPEQATWFHAPGSISGRLWSSKSVPDSDIFAFDAKKGEKWILETTAARRGSPLDTRIEVLSTDGKPVERLMLQAVRNSAVTFRGIDSNTADCRVDNWEEMELNQYLYLQGEVVKLFRAPQGPDSGFLFYSLNGKRHCFFDTSATTHALEEPCYIVEPHPPGTKVAANGLPAFKLYYANDDDGERKSGSDSKLYFNPPADGKYLIRVTDSRGFSGERFVYELTARLAKPDFHLTIGPSNLSIAAGSGKSFTVSADRIDGFEGEIKLDITGLPPGFSVSTPLVIEAGQNSASGTIYCSLDAPAPGTNASSPKIVASAMLEGHSVSREMGGLGMLKKDDQPKLFVKFEPDAGNMIAKGMVPAEQPLEITIAPGTIVPAWLKVKRNGHTDLITFTVENLPHGVIVDNIGLNGVLIPKEQNERQIFLKAAKWVPESDRLCYAVENQAGNQTSRPLMLHVRRSSPQTASAR
jgi:WD40 repeat protein